MPVSIRRHNHIATVTANAGQDGQWSGDLLLVNSARQVIYQNGWERADSLSDELAVAQRVAQKLGDCEVVGVDRVISCIREGWIQLLRDHLMTDVGHANRLTTGKTLGCTIEARGRKQSLKYGNGRVQRWPVTGVVYVGDPSFLQFTSQKGITWYPKVRWEYIECIRFSYWHGRERS